MTIRRFGVGFNLRPEWLDAVIALKPDITHFEIIADNWLSPGPHQKKLELIRQDYEILFHCVGMNLGGLDIIDFDYLASIKTLANHFQPLHISDHMCMQSHKSHHFHDLLPIPLSQDNLERCSQRIQQTMDILQTEFLIENLSYYTEYESSLMNEGEFIAEICEKTGAKILLDLNNIWVNDKNLNQGNWEFLNYVSNKVVGEIHLAGPEENGGFLVDTHGDLVHEDVIKKFRAIIHNLNVPIIYERDNNLPSVGTMIEICQSLEASFS